MSYWHIFTVTHAHGTATRDLEYYADSSAFDSADFAKQPEEAKITALNPISRIDILSKTVDEQVNELGTTAPWRLVPGIIHTMLPPFEGQWGSFQVIEVPSLSGKEDGVEIGRKSGVKLWRFRTPVKTDANGVPIPA